MSKTLVVLLLAVIMMAAFVTNVTADGYVAVSLNQGAKSIAWECSDQGSALVETWVDTGASTFTEITNHGYAEVIGQQYHEGGRPNYHMSPGGKIGYQDLSNQAFLKDGDTRTSIPGFSAWLVGINEAGMLVGVTNGSKTMLYDSTNGAREIASSLAPYQRAVGVTDSGSVVINTTEQYGYPITAYLWNATQGATEIKTPWNGNMFIKAVSTNGQMVGTTKYRENEIYKKKIFVHDGSECTEIASVPNWGLEPTCINNDGWVAGYAICEDPGTSEECLTRAWLWDGTMVRFLPAAKDGEACYAYGINSSGWIAGVSGLKATEGSTGAVLWQPVPEPSALAGLSGGILMLPIMLRRRRR